MIKNIFQTLALTGILTVAVGNFVYADPCTEKCEADHKTCYATAEQLKGNAVIFGKGGKLECDEKQIACFRACQAAARH